MTHIWNIYQPADLAEPGPDPFDVFVYSLRRSDEPHLGDCIYVEGCRCKVIALAPDRNRMEMIAAQDESYWKVCVG